MRLDLETEVRYPEGDRAGVIRSVILDEENQASAIVLATDDLVSRDVIVPLDLLSEEPGGVVTINLTPDDLADLEDYSEERVPAIPDGWRMSRNAAPGGDVFPEMMYQPLVPVMEVPDLPEGTVAISQGTALWCLDGPWGIVDDVLVDDNGQVYALIGRPDSTEELDRVIPMDLVAQVDADRATLNCTLADLPTYTQDTGNEREEPEPD
jgi:hypothetical protein